MKSVLKICGMSDLNDINKVRSAISSNEGVVACEISADKGEANIVYDNRLVEIEQIIETIEELGYAVI